MTAPFENATGKGLRVAVIDSGVNPAHPHISAVAGGRAVGVKPDAVTDPSYLDKLGHGTAVMAAIQEKAPASAYSAVRVFHTALKTTGATLVEAIDWCTDEGFDVVNLSLGSTNPAHQPRFGAAAARADAAGTLLVSAREIDGTLCYPGALPTVFSVALDWEWPRESFRLEEVDGAPVYYASGYPRPAPGIPPQRNLYGISFAVANMTGIVVRAAEADGGARAGRGARVARALAEEFRRLEDQRR